MSWLVAGTKHWRYWSTVWLKNSILCLHRQNLTVRVCMKCYFVIPFVLVLMLLHHHNAAIIVLVVQDTFPCFSVLGSPLSQSYDVTPDAREMLLCRCCKHLFSLWYVFWYLLTEWLNVLSGPCYVGVPHGSGCYSRERSDSLSAGESAFWISQNRLSSQTSGEYKYKIFAFICMLAG